MSTNSKLIKLSTIVALIGFLISLFLLYSEITNSFYCIVEEHFFDCSKVNKSSYASILGVPISLIGVIYYLSIIIAAIMISKQIKDKILLDFVLPVVTTLGLFFSIYLTLIEAIVIQKFCEYCLVSAICSTSLAVIYLINPISKLKEKK
ncbi:MAG: vitamin K epoxide reductase family protein [Candidatus Heimdallarchaeum endolithica]|uniref:Vitamin K epoxide reductase family protein n=1 Tax=Candidatus Heimdallarchaeum endolithica TaxID=2876572 RepID=A0A9Y1FNU6_9ARCH|nr:MAG: vitamin K epoxide reductase family protein [Candidatus Heimdallarchaeum endolithica]